MTRATRNKFNVYVLNLAQWYTRSRVHPFCAQSVSFLFLVVDFVFRFFRSRFSHRHAGVVCSVVVLFRFELIEKIKSRQFIDIQVFCKIAQVTAKVGR